MNCVYEIICETFSKDKNFICPKIKEKCWIKTYMDGFVRKEMRKIEKLLEKDNE